MQVFVPCMKSTSARAWDESKTARRHITIPRVQWNVCPARPCRGRRERDLFHASRTESQVGLVLFPLDNGLSPLVARLLQLVGVDASNPHKRVGSTKVEWPGICRSCRLTPRLLACSAARRGTDVDIGSLARRFFRPRSFRCCFFGEEIVRVLPFSSITLRTNTASCTTMVGQDSFSV